MKKKVIEEKNHTKLINNPIINWLLYMLGYAIVLI